MMQSIIFLLVQFFTLGFTSFDDVTARYDDIRLKDDKHRSPDQNTVSNHSFDYVIVGAGPSGLQMAYFLMSKNRSYVILEKEKRAGIYIYIIYSTITIYYLNKWKTLTLNRDRELW